MVKAAKRVIPIRVERTSSLSAHDRAAVLDAVARLEAIDGPLLPVLHAVQDALGFIPQDAVPLIAEGLNLSRAEVHGTLSFYHGFRTGKPGRHVIHLCRAEACQAVGAVSLERHAKKTLAVDWHGTTRDGAVTLEPVYCLGNCALGPSLLVGETLCGRVTPERFDQLVADLRS
jgi:formate dehydrogenase subunit gamma